MQVIWTPLSTWHILVALGLAQLVSFSVEFPPQKDKLFVYKLSQFLSKKVAIIYELIY